MERYDKYKPSGIDWIGEVPEHWEMKKTKFVAGLCTGNSLNAQQKAFYGEIPEDVNCRPYVASKDIARDTEFIDYENGIRIPVDGCMFEIAPANSTLLCIEGGSAGKKMGFVDREVCYVNKLCCYKTINLNAKYFYYFIKSKSFWEVFSQNLQGMIGGVSVGVLKDIKIPVPAQAEQEAIAAYLDERCGDIDKVVATQEKRIELLKELKQSEITKAVTRGLNPNVAMKDSGVEWIGMVPEHWEVKRIKYTGSFGNGLTYSPKDVCDDGVLVIRSSNIQGGMLTLSDNVFVKVAPKELMVEKGDIIICSRNGSAALVGKSCYINNDINATFGAFMMRYKPSINSKYGSYLIQTTIGNYKGLFTTTTINQLTKDMLSQMFVPVSPIDEQVAIVEYLDCRCAEIDKQIEAVTKQIDLLREYKQSLITEVVTGKRKVC